MITLLVPIDFTESSFNAAEYAAELSKEIAVSRIILIKSYHVSIYEQLLCSADFVQITNEDIERDTQAFQKRLDELCRRLSGLVKPGTSIQSAVSKLSLLRSINQTAGQENVNLVIIGSTGPGSEEESDISYNAVRIGKACPVPVLVVPSGCKFSPVKRAVVACDFKKVSREAGLSRLKELFKEQGTTLMVLNVDPNGKHLAGDEAFQSEEKALHELLGDLDYRIYYSDDTDIIKGITDFSDQHDAQLIVALPKEYSFFQSLTHRSITEALSTVSHQPVLILK